MRWNANGEAIDAFAAGVRRGRLRAAAEHHGRVMDQRSQDGAGKPTQDRELAAHLLGVTRQAIARYAKGDDAGETRD